MICDETITARSSGSASVGTLLAYEIESNCLYAKTDQAELIKVSLYEQGIVRVQMTRKESFNPMPYALEEHIRTIPFDFLERPDGIVISTDQLEVFIAKSPVRISFMDKKGKVLCEDDQAFGTSWIGEQVTTYKKLQPQERFLGLGEKTGPLDKRGYGYQNWNTDYFGYGTDSDPLYCSIPFYLGIQPNGQYGIFFNNSHKTHFSFGASNNRFTSFSADAGDMDYFFIHYPDLTQIIQAYARLTGKMPLPPKWSLGYQQCRYSYYPDSEVLSTAQKFRDKEIPADAIVLDIHYMDQYKIFSWDPKHFPDPKGMISKLAEMDFNVVIMCDPGIKRESEYHAYESGKNENVFVPYPDGTLYEGEVWPGWCHFPDFTNPKARAWWAKQLKSYTDLGIRGYWNDMNEIATWGNALPELLEFDFDGNKTSSREARNVYGMLMAKSTMEGVKQNLDNERPFNLTRAGFAGIQRYAAVWTGDNTASDDHMMMGMRMLGSMALSGVSFAGFDAGGFIGNSSEALFSRWISLAAFTPFFRGHSNVNTKSSEPWAHGEHTEEISRNYISLRYQLMPYIYSCFHESSLHGTPIMRPLALTHPYEDLVYQKNYENEYTFGPNLLVAPVRSDKTIEKVYLPTTQWYDLFTDTPYEGGNEVFVECPLEKLPVFIKGGAIIPTQAPIQSNQSNRQDTLEIHAYKGSKDSTFVYYDDDGKSYDFESGHYFSRLIHLSSSAQRITFEEATGTYESPYLLAKVYLHGFSPTSTAKLDTEDYRFISPLSNFDPIDKDCHQDYCIKNLPYIIVEWKNEKTCVQW